MDSSDRTDRVLLSDDEARAVRSGRWVQIDLGAYHEIPCGRTRSALVGFSRGKVTAWANACLHQPLPLDVSGDPEWIVPGVRAAPMDDDRVHLLCHSHGALYRTFDGFCTSGPCEGQSLVPLRVSEEAGKVTVSVPEFSEEPGADDAT